MPKKLLIEVPVPPIKPDCCKLCPFIGMIPKHKRKAGSKKTMLCIATLKAMSKESISIKESERAGTRHIHHRPCDNVYEAWKDYRHGFPVGKEIYKECRVPYQQLMGGAYEIDFGDDNN